VDGLRFGVVGTTGAAAGALCASGSSGGDYQVVAIQGVAAGAEHYRSFVRRRGLDAIYLSVPASRRFAFAKLALEAGLHVISAEPFAASAREWAGLLRSLRRHEPAPLLAFQSAMAPAHRASRAILGSGTLGGARVLSTLACTRDSDPEPALMGCLSQARDLLGANPVEVLAASRHEAESMLSVALRFPEERIALIACGFNRTPALRYDLVAEGGGVRVRSAPSASSDDELRATIGGIPLERKFSPAAALDSALREFCAEIARGAGGLGMARDALVWTRVLAAIERASRAERSVRLKHARAGCDYAQSSIEAL
jgi:predicted dehydrogenase